jgi:putative membrane protein
MHEQVFALKYIVASIVYSFLGIGILLVALVIFDWVTPKKLWVEIVEEKNMPLAVTAAAMTIAVALIVAAAIHG